LIFLVYRFSYYFLQKYFCLPLREFVEGILIYETNTFAISKWNSIQFFQLEFNITQYVCKIEYMYVFMYTLYHFKKLVELTLLSVVITSISLQRAILAKISLIFSNYVYCLIKFYESSFANGSTYKLYEMWLKKRPL